MIGTLSLCLIVKNEERNLPRCLDSVRGLAGELIIVDTGSTDGTPSIAAGYGAEVVPFDFTIVDFAAARNHAIARASGRWILMLDADETLDRGQRAHARKAHRARPKRGVFPGAAQSLVGFRRIPPRITSSGSFPTGRTIGTAAAFMKPSTPRFCPEAGGCIKPASASITILLRTRKRGAARTTGISRS